MGLSEESFRTIKTRGITLSIEQMENFRIINIFNSVGDPEYLNEADAREMMTINIKRGEFCLLEAANEEKLFVISLIIFEDIWSRNVFALMNWEYYDGFPDLITLYN
jgi:hypothetical protein